MQDYKVQLDSYSGPMDLLLYLIRREEVDIYDIPIAHILEQYLGYVRLLENLDPDSIGDFLVLAATLMEIKSRLLLPKPPPEVSDDDSLDPRADVVRQLLAYRSFREAAVYLDQRAEMHSRRFARPRTDAPEVDNGEIDIEDAQIWDLLTAFKKLLDAVGQERVTHEVIYDDTPVGLHAADILDRLEREGPSMTFEQVFEGRRRSEMIGLFLALLELMRQKRVRVQQDMAFGTIRIHLIDATPITVIGEGVALGPETAETEETDEVGEGGAAEGYTDAGMEEAGAAERAEAARTSSAAGEGFFEDDDLDEEEDEFSRRINAVRVEDVDMGRSTGEGATVESDGPDESDELPDVGDGTGGIDIDGRVEGDEHESRR